MKTRALVAICIAVLLAACSVFTPKTSGSHNYAGAGMLAASGVAAAGVNRAVTGYCWAACRPGTTCNRESGLCEPLHCSSTCPADLKCAIVGGAPTCVHPKAEALVVAPLDGGTATDAASEPSEPSKEAGE